MNTLEQIKYKTTIKKKEIVQILEFINSIPDSVSWTLAGITGAITAITLYKVEKIFNEIIKDYFTDDDEVAT